MKKGYDGTDLSKRLRTLMIANNTRQQKLAELLDISRQSVAQYLDGSAQPSIDKLYKMAEYFACSSDYLLGLSPYRNHQEESELRQTSTSDDDVSHFGIGIYKEFKDYSNFIDKVNAYHGTARINRYLFGECPFSHVRGILAAYHTALEELVNRTPATIEDRGRIIEQFLHDVQEADESGAFIKLLLEEMR